MVCETDLRNLEKLKHESAYAVWGTKGYSKL